jgi:hypothetical protein
MSAEAWAVVTDDEHACFGPLPSEDDARHVAKLAARVYDLDARVVRLHDAQVAVGELEAQS